MSDFYSNFDGFYVRNGEIFIYNPPTFGHTPAPAPSSETLPRKIKYTEKMSHTTCPSLKPKPESKAKCTENRGKKGTVNI